MIGYGKGIYIGILVENSSMNTILKSKKTRTLLLLCCVIIGVVIISNIISNNGLSQFNNELIRCCQPITEYLIDEYNDKGKLPNNLPNTYKNILQSTDKITTNTGVRCDYFNALYVGPDNDLLDPKGIWIEYRIGSMEININWIPRIPNDTIKCEWIIDTHIAFKLNEQ